MNMVPRWLNMKAACEYAGVSRNTMKRMILDGDIIAGRTPGRHFRVDRESIEKHFGSSDEKALAILRSLRV